MEDLLSKIYLSLLCISIVGIRKDFSYEGSLKSLRRITLRLIYLITYSGSIIFVGRGKFKRLGSGAAPFGVSTKSRARVAVEPATFCAVH